MSAKTYKIRKFQNGRNQKGETYTNYSLTVPGPIAEHLPTEMSFTCELTEDGILFKPAHSQEESIELPSWAKANGKKKPVEA